MSRFMRTGRGWSVVALCLLTAGVLAGCRPGGPRPPRPSTTTTVTTRPTAVRPVAVVESGTTTLRLNAFGCWTDGLCVDPPPPGGLDDWPDIGAADEVTITIGLEGTAFRAWFSAPVEGGGVASPGVPGTLTRTGPTTWRLRPPPEPGTYVVSVFGDGAMGDLTYVFRWTVG
jgi:hypothetical protein